MKANATSPTFDMRDFDLRHYVIVVLQRNKKNPNTVHGKIQSLD